MTNEHKPHPQNREQLKAGFSVDVLLIEDDHSYAELVKILLASSEEFTSNIDVAYTLQDGLAILDKKEYDAVLLDLNLPDSTGLNTLDSLLTAVPNANVIVLTGSSDKKQGVQAVGRGAQDYLVKGDFENQHLSRALRFSIERRNILVRLEEAQRIAKVGHWECRPEQNYFYASDQVYLLFGLDPTYKKLTFKDICCSDCPLSVLSSPLLKDEQDGTMEYTINKPEDNHIETLLNYRIEKNENNVLTLFGTIQDITLQKQSEELRRTRDLAVETSRIREQVVANVSHELRTPMNAIQGMSNLLIDMPMNLQQKECVEAIKDASDVLLGIINDILLASSLQNGDIPINRTSFDLQLAIRRLTDILIPKALDKGLQLDYQFASPITDQVVGDKQRLSQVIFNLIGNAIKFTEKGSILLTIKPLPQKVQSILDVMFIIKDTGVGIPKTKQQEIFDAFTRIHQPGQTVEGTGLGLAISKQLIERMKGSISLQSEKGKGSTFTFTLPFGVASTQEDNKNINDPTRSIKSFSGFNTILVVEDHQMNQLVIEKTLLHKWPNLDVLIANNGEEALHLLSHQEVDIIIMDVQMPGLNGFETTRYIRQQLQLTHEKLPIIAMTAHSQINNSADYIESGMSDYILKPFEPNELFKKITQYF